MCVCVCVCVCVHVCACASEPVFGWVGGCACVLVWVGVHVNLCLSVCVCVSLCGTRITTLTSTCGTPYRAGGGAGRVAGADPGAAECHRQDADAAVT